MISKNDSRIRSWMIRILLLTGFIFTVKPAFTQSKFELSGGLGVPEYLNARIKYGQKIQAGVCAGFIAGTFYGNAFFNGSIAAEITCHLLGQSKYVEQPPWYLLGGLGYYYLPMSADYGQYKFAFYPRIGRTINFSKKSGLNLDFGAFLPLSEESYYHPNRLEFKVLLSCSIGLFLRLK
ncbi:MAG: hypothetical protein WCP08_08900 [Prolixibacteraceae bacterium]